LFLSAASLVEIEAVIERIRHHDAKRADALQAWLDGLIETFWDRIPRQYRKIRSRSSGVNGQPCMMADRAVRHPQFACGRRDAAEPGGGFEGAQGVQ
jgi:hypothetical protein